MIFSNRSGIPARRDFAGTTANMPGAGAGFRIWTSGHRIRGGIPPLLLLLLLILPLPARGYVLMGEHVLDRMVEALGPAVGLEIAQTLTLYTAPSPLPKPLTLQETVWIQRPADFRADAFGEGYERRLLFADGAALMAVDGLLQPEPPPLFTRYHDVLVRKPRRTLTEHLRKRGIDVTISSLGRWEDTYCYVVGARYPNEDAPQLWVTKDTFLPFRLILPSSTPAGDGTVEIRYRNWTFVDDTAYPMHVVMLRHHQVMQEVRVDRVTVNPDPTDSRFDPDVFREAYAVPPETDAPWMRRPEGPPVPFSDPEPVQDSLPEKK